MSLKLLKDLEQEIRQYKLKELGWKFLMTGPNEFQWMKFNGNRCIAQQGDEVWETDNETM